MCDPHDSFVSHFNVSWIPNTEWQKANVKWYRILILSLSFQIMLFMIIYAMSWYKRVLLLRWFYENARSAEKIIISHNKGIFFSHRWNYWFALVIMFALFSRRKFSAAWLVGGSEWEHLHRLPIARCLALKMVMESLCKYHSNHEANRSHELPCQDTFWTID